MNHILDIFNQINSLEVNMVNCMFRLVLSMFLGMIGCRAQTQGTDSRHTHIRPHLYGRMPCDASLHLRAPGVSRTEERRPGTHRGAGHHRHRFFRRRRDDTHERSRARTHHCRRHLDDGNHRHGGRHRNVSLLRRRDTADSSHPCHFRAI